MLLCVISPSTDWTVLTGGSCHPATTSLGRAARPPSRAGPAASDPPWVCGTQCPGRTPMGTLGLANRTVTRGWAPPARPCPSKVGGAWRHNGAPFKTYQVSQDQLCSCSIHLFLLLTQIRAKCLFLMRCWAPTHLSTSLSPRLPTSQVGPDSGSAGTGHAAYPAPEQLAGRGQRPRCPRLTPHAASSRPWTGRKGGMPVARTCRNHSGGSACDRKMTRVPATRALLLTKSTLLCKAQEPPVASKKKDFKVTPKGQRSFAPHH